MKIKYNWSFKVTYGTWLPCNVVSINYENNTAVIEYCRGNKIVNLDDLEQSTNGQ